MKRFSYVQNVGKCRHVVNFHDGIKTHSDGSPFYDVRIFGRARDAQRFMRDLRLDGYTVSL